MNTKLLKDNDKLVVQVEGRIDSNTAPELFKTVNDSLQGLTSLVVDLEKVDYISSAGLRVLLSFEKAMSAQGTMVVKNVDDKVMEVFELTGFDEILTIE